MAKEIKPTVDFESTLGALDIRLGRVLRVEPASRAPKPSYRLTIDFGGYGHKISVGRFTLHKPEDLIGKQIMGVLNFGTRKIGDEVSEVLVIGVQYPKADSGEATFVTPAVEAKLGSKLF